MRVPSVGRARILVVDDDPDVRWVAAECLRGIGHGVTEARAGGTALTILERGEPFDLVDIDLAMPGLSGAETVRLARRTHPDLKVLFCTGYADVPRFEAETGGDALLRKPFRPDTLIDSVQRALQREPAREPRNVVPLRRGHDPAD
jgi:CheY-like chemotaxis protein